jgi:hypothetical protein
MLLTKKSSSTSGHGSRSHSSFVHNLQRGLASALPTMDRRAFLRRSGLGVGVGLAATQLTLVKKAKAAEGKSIDGTGKIEVKRTVCTHCSVGCATDAIVENGVWVRQLFDHAIVEAEPLLPREGLARQLEKRALVGRRHAQSSPIRNRAKRRTETASPSFPEISLISWPTVLASSFT